jgi:flagellar motility protein MotE (MotC chaperone)
MTDELFQDAIEIILSHKTLQELSAKDSRLAKQITHEILNFIDKTKRNIGRIKNPFETEEKHLRDFAQVEENNFQAAWDIIAPFLQETYEQPVFDTEFYYRQFQMSYVHFESVKEHFTEKWSALLFQKQTAWELKFIDNERKKFCKELYKQMEDLKKLQELLAPFFGELGRLWDMSKGRRQKIGFDFLKKYAELLQKDKSLQELAEMLGRMHRAEKEYEDEIFTHIVLKPDWKTEHAQKTDLIGIHESNDISSMLPSEAALLADKTLELLLYKKFAEKKLQTFEYQGKILAEE